MGGQVRALLNGVDVLVATPGRLLDLVRGNALRLGEVECLVLDEADRMLDMGFIHDIRKIVAKLPAQRQTLMFSATMPRDIAELAAQMLRDPVKVAVAPVATTVERVEQRVIRVDRAAKPAILIDVLRRETIDRALIFTRTKHGADKVVRGLVQAGIGAEAIHGNKSQNQRERVLAAFRKGDVRILVATDIAARGIDVDGISHVVNFDLPNVPETYVHRIGRTARAGAAGHRDLAVRRRGDGLPARHREAHSHDHSGERPTHRSTAGGAIRPRSAALPGSRRCQTARHSSGGRGGKGRVNRRRDRPMAAVKQTAAHTADQPNGRDHRRGRGRHRFCCLHAGQRPSRRATALNARRISLVTQKEHNVPKEELLEFEGLVTEILPDARYRVQLDNGHLLVAYTAGRMKKNRIKTLAGDRVTVEVSPYDLEKGRLIFRHKDERAGASQPSAAAAPVPAAVMTGAGGASAILPSK